MNHLMTEREWRSRGMRHSIPDWWGAQCVITTGRKGRLSNRFIQLLLIVLSVWTALILPMVIPHRTTETFADVKITPSQQTVPRSVTAVRYDLPPLVYEKHTATVEQLLNGKMLLLNERYPLPKNTPAPNTFSVAAYGKGMVPVRSLQVKAGRETIYALLQLFERLRLSDVNGLYVWQGTQSIQEQRSLRIEALRSGMTTADIAQAVKKVRASFDQPGTGDLLQEYTVELRFLTGENTSPDPQRLEETPDGQTLLQLAWRYGFIRPQPDAQDNRAFRFRYVGKAHATAMTYLDLNMEHYLQWLHERKAITIWSGGKPQYLIVCQPVTGRYVDFQLPKDAEYELSLDNMGYAVAACAL